MAARLGASSAGQAGNLAQQTSVTATSYAGYGAYGQTGTASFTWNTQSDSHDTLYRTSLQVQMPQQRIIMPTWSSWVENTYSSQASATLTVDTLNYPQHVWQAWITHDNDGGDHAQYQLNQQGLEEVRRENERREAQYQQQRAQYVSPEAVEERRRLAQERLQKAAEETKRKETAEEVAQVLLGEIIGPEQLAVYKETGRLLVKGKKHDYIVWKTGKVQRIERGRVVDLCVYTQQKITMPETDNVIGLAMHIKADEKEFNKIANPGAPRQRPSELQLAANY